MKRKKFSASYPAASQLDYSRQANRCRLLPAKSKRYKELGCKREEHLMIEGGRSHLRYPDYGPYPRDRTQGGPAAQGKRASEKTRRRLSEELPPWNERTQSRKSVGRRVDLTAQIADSIARYRQANNQQAGFSVPYNHSSLTAYGMPPKAAWILSERAGGRFYPEVGLAFPKRSLLEKVEAAVGSPLVFRGQSLETQKALGFGDVLGIRLRVDGRVRKRLDTGTIFKLAATEGVRQLTPSDQKAIGKLFRALSTLARKEKGKSKAYLIEFSGLKDDVVIPLSDGEHSKSLQGSASSRYPEYKTLNVSLVDLPNLLARLSRRKKKKGRRLKQLSAKENPMPSDDWYYRKQYSKSPYGARRSVPAARRNRGNSIGESMAKRAMHLHHHEGMPLKAAWKHVKSEARANGYKKARKNGGWYFGRGHGGGPKGSNLYLPDTTVVGPALVPHAPWDDGTEIFSALVPGPYAKRNAGKKRRRKGTKKEREYMWASGKAKKYKARSNPQAAEAMELFHSGQAPSLKAAWKMVKSGHARKNRSRRRR